MSYVSTETALSYLKAGLSCLPARKAEKRPVVGSWKTWSERLPTECEVTAWFANRPDAICIAAGKVSGNLECLDFDDGGSAFAPWCKLIPEELLKRLVVEQSPSGGRHVCYRAAEEVDGNRKLALAPDKHVLIETRGEGGLFLCAPSEGYVLRQGSFENLPTLSSEERMLLLDAARSLNEYGRENRLDLLSQHRWESRSNLFSRPGDDFAARGDIRPILVKHGWALIGKAQDGNELWRRPGKTSGSHSATFDGKVLYVFSSNAAPFESERGYGPFQVYAILECGGDYTRAARELLAQGYGEGGHAGRVTLPETLVGSDYQAARGALGDRALPSEPHRRLPIGELVATYPKMREPLIHGFLRIGETMNIIAPPKTGKSWLVTDLALSVATGTPWFGYPCEKGKVLIIDNELHPETSASRIPKVIAARGMTLEAVRDDIVVENQRGHLATIEDLAQEIDELKPYGFKLVIIDAFYRAIPKGTDENDNGTIAGVYNLIDRYAAALGCAFVLIHHTSKGNQALKSVTDVGAGAGSLSRAADAHVILRRHRERGVVVMDSVVRSFPSTEPICLRWNWPVWNREDTCDPEDLEGKMSDPHKDDPEPNAIANKLVELVDMAHPESKGVFTSHVRSAYGVMAKTAKLAVEIALSSGKLRCERLEHQPKGMQATKFILLPTAV